eukprot:2740968-Rhodomonas_salina.1
MLCTGAAITASSCLLRIHSAAPPATNRSPPTPPHTPAISAVLSEDDEEAEPWAPLPSGTWAPLPELQATHLKLSSMVTWNTQRQDHTLEPSCAQQKHEWGATAVLGPAVMALTPAISVNAFSLNLASSSAANTTSICTLAVAELQPARSLRSARRAPQLSSPSRREVVLHGGLEGLLERSARGARLGACELHLDLEHSHLVLGHVERRRQHRPRCHRELNLSSARPRARVRGWVGLEQHATARTGRPVLVERDEREEVDLLRDLEQTLARGLRRRPLVPGVDPEGSHVAAVEGVAGADGADKVLGELARIHAVAQDRRHEARLARIPAVREARLRIVPVAGARAGVRGRGHHLRAQRSLL